MKCYSCNFSEEWLEFYSTWLAVTGQENHRDAIPKVIYFKENQLLKYFIASENKTEDYYIFKKLKKM